MNVSACVSEFVLGRVSVCVFFVISFCLVSSMLRLFNYCSINSKLCSKCFSILKIDITVASTCDLSTLFKVAGTVKVNEIHNFYKKL